MMARSRSAPGLMITCTFAGGDRPGKRTAVPPMIGKAPSPSVLAGVQRDVARADRRDRARGRRVRAFLVMSLLTLPVALARRTALEKR